MAHMLTIQCSTASRVMDICFMSLEGKLGDAEFSDCPLNMLERGKHDSKEAWESIFLCLMINTV